MPAGKQKHGKTHQGPPVSPTRRWLITSLLGLSAVVGIQTSGVLDGLHMTARLLLPITIGWTVVLVFAPWYHVAAERRRRAAISKLTKFLNRFAEGDRTARLSTLKSDVSGDVGELNQSVYRVLSGAVASRIEASNLQRNLEHKVAKQTQRATAALQREATTDPLTGLGNRRLLDTVLAEMMADDDRRARFVAVMAIDVDKFKEINDTLGHDVGDTCLRHLGQVLQSTLRNDDIAIRNGGDEFLLLMPNVSPADAHNAAERITSLFGQLAWPHARSERPTLSIGIVTGNLAHVKESGELVRRADEALYESKRTGRAKITIGTRIRFAA